MKILLAASEVAPFAKTGGLADVAGSLPGELHRLGHDVRIFMPLYRTVREKGFELQPLDVEPAVEIAGEMRRGRLWQGRLNDIPVYFLQQDHYFDRQGLYGTPQGDFPDNAERFGFLARALLAALPQLDFRPDVLHLNDWQTGLVPVLLRSELAENAFYAGTGTLLTIHNLGYQGLFPVAAAQELGLDPGLLTIDGLEYYGQMSFLKGGVVFADAVNTVSETYCLEIQTPEMGHGFEGILRARSETLFGVLNGIDDRAWDPRHDPVLAASYSADDPGGKAVNKRLLQKELGLRDDPDVPLLAMVTRLATQKGLDLVEQAWKKMLSRRLQIVLLGAGDQHYMDHFAALRDVCPERVSINLSFDDALARHIYAGSDLFLMPSHYEPCGLGQLIALRYGSVPLVRKTGGLADTVFDPAEEPRRANGFCFREGTAAALLAALDRALALYGDAPAWQRLVRAGMSQDFSWQRSAGRYLELYALAWEARNV